MSTKCPLAADDRTYKGASGLAILFNRVRTREARDQGDIQAKWSPNKPVYSGGAGIS